MKLEERLLSRGERLTFESSASDRGLKMNFGKKMPERRFHDICVRGDGRATFARHGLQGEELVVGG